jgi:hypothetical protein
LAERIRNNPTDDPEAGLCRQTMKISVKRWRYRARVTRQRITNTGVSTTTDQTR